MVHLAIGTIAVFGFYASYSYASTGGATVTPTSDGGAGSVYASTGGG